MGLIVGNRGFFPDHLAKTGREEMIQVLEKAGIDVIVLGTAESKHGAVETYEEAKRCAALFKSKADAIDGVIVTAGRPCEVSNRSRKRPSNHAPNAMRPVEQFAGNLAHAIEIGDRDHVLMRGNLKDTVSGGVDDGLSRAHMFFAEFFDNLGA